MMQEEVEAKKMEPEAASTFVIGEPPLQEENNAMVATLSQAIIAEPPQHVEDERHGDNGVALDASNDGVLGADDDGNDGNEDVRQVALSEQPQSTTSQSPFEFHHQGNGNEQEMPPASVLSTTIAHDNDDDFDDFIAVAADANHQNDDVIIGGQAIVGLASNVSVSKSPSPIDEGGDEALRQVPLPVEVESVVASRIPLAAAPLSSSPHLIQAIRKKEDDEFGDFDEASSTTTSLDLVEGHGQQQEMELQDVTEEEKEMVSIPPSHKMPSSISPPLLADHDGSFVEPEVVITSSIKKEGIVPDAMDDALSTGAVTNAPSKDDNDLIAVPPSSVTATNTGLNSPAALEEVSISSSPTSLPPITREADVEEDEQQQQHEEEKEREGEGKKEHETEDDFGNFEEWQASPPSGTKGAGLDYSHEQQEEVHGASSSVARLGDAHSSSVEGPSDQALEDDDGGAQPDDDWGDFNEAPQFASSVFSSPIPMDPLVSPSTAVSAESLSSSLPALRPIKPTENRATFGEQGWKGISKRVEGFFEEAYGPPSHQAEHSPGVSLPAEKKALSLDENFDRSLPLGRYFEAHASKWAVKTLTEELMRSLRNDGTHGEEEGDEKEEIVVSITWALASPAPSRPASSVCHQSVDLRPTSQTFGFASERGKEKKEHHDARLSPKKTDRLTPQLASANSSDSIDSPTDLDFDLLGGGGGGGAEAGRDSSIGKGSSSRPSPDHFSRAFLDIGLEGRPSSRTNGRRGGKALEKDNAAAKSPNERQQQQQEVNSSNPTKALRKARKGPLSASAETFVNTIPDWTYMRARLPQLPHNLNSS